MSAGSADLAVAVELLERLVRSADAAQQQHALSLVLSGLRARCHALAAAEASDADAAPGSGGAQGGQSLAEEAALLAARLIRLAQQAPGDVCRAVAGGVCAAWASLRAAENFRSSVCKESTTNCPYSRNGQRNIICHSTISHTQGTTSTTSNVCER